MVKGILLTIGFILAVGGFGLTVLFYFAAAMSSATDTKLEIGKHVFAGFIGVALIVMALRL